MKAQQVLSGIPPDDSVHYYCVLGLELGSFIATPFVLLLAALTDRILLLWLIPMCTALGAARGMYRDRHIDWDFVYAHLATHQADPSDPTFR